MKELGHDIEYDYWTGMFAPRRVIKRIGRIETK
jgi:hypothetical protein